MKNIIYFILLLFLVSCKKESHEQKEYSVKYIFYSKNIPYQVFYKIQIKTTTDNYYDWQTDSIYTENYEAIKIFYDIPSGAGFNARVTTKDWGAKQTTIFLDNRQLTTKQDSTPEMWTQAIP